MPSPWTTPLQGQQRLWIAEQLAADTVYHVPAGLRLHGDLDEEALLQAIRGVVARHDSLRCALLLDDDGQLRCAVREPGSFCVERVELTGPDAADRLADFALSFLRRRFDLAAEVLRVALVRVAAREHVLLVVGHHVVFDDWAVAVFFRELEVGYLAACHGRDPGRMLPPLDYGYADLADDEQALVADGLLERQTGFWSDTLDGGLPCELPLDRPRPAAPSGSGVPLVFAVPEPYGRQLLELGRAHGATGFMTAVAVFHALLRRRTGREDITVGIPVSGRTSAQRERLIVNLMNMLAVRSRLPGKPRFVDLLGAVRGAVLGAFANQEATLSDALGRLRGRHPAEKPPSIGILFELQNTGSHMAAFLGVTDDDLPAFPGVHTSAYPIPETTIRYDLEMKLAVTGPGKIDGVLVYSPDVFEDATMHAMIEEFQAIIAAVVRDPFVVLDDARLAAGGG